MIANAYISRNLNFDSAIDDWAMDANNAAREKTFSTLRGTDNERPATYMLTGFHGPLGNHR